MINLFLKNRSGIFIFLILSTLFSFSSVYAIVDVGAGKNMSYGVNIYPKSTTTSSGPVNSSNISHNDLAGIQGGAAGQYYHISLAWFNELTSDLMNYITKTEGDTYYAGIQWGYNMTTSSSFTGVLSNNLTLIGGGTMINLSVPDSTIKIYSAEHTNFGSNNGEALEFWGLYGDSKPYLGWYSIDNETNSTPRSVGWIGCHFNLSNGNTHRHCSWETLDNSTGTPIINSHFEIGYGSNVSRPSVKFPDSDVQFISDQKLYFGDTKQGYLQYNSGTGDMEVSGNAKFKLQTPSGLEMNGYDILNVDDIFSVALGTLDLKAYTTIRLFPHGQSTIGLNIGNDSTGSLTANALGSEWLLFNDNFNVTAGKKICITGGSCLGDSSTLANSTTLTLANITNNIWAYNQSTGSFNEYGIYWYNQSTIAYNINTSYVKWWYNMTTTAVILPNSTTLTLANITNNIWGYNQTTGTFNQYGLWWYNQSAIAYGMNTSYVKWWYNQSLVTYNLNTSYVKWWYNQSLIAYDINTSYNKWWYNMTIGNTGTILRKTYPSECSIPDGSPVALGSYGNKAEVGVGASGTIYCPVHINDGEVLEGFAVKYGMVASVAGDVVVNLYNETTSSTVEYTTLLGTMDGSGDAIATTYVDLTSSATLLTGETMTYEVVLTGGSSLYPANIFFIETNLSRRIY